MVLTATTGHYVEEALEKRYTMANRLLCLILYYLSSFGYVFGLKKFLG